MTERPADQASRLAAIEGSSSFIVQAPAGSGKTELLTNRFLRLLATVPRPQCVLAITFTRKATREMLDRVLGKLRQAESGRMPEKPHEQEAFRLAASVLQRDRELGWDILLNPSQLQVHTIDGLCSRLAGGADTEEAGPGGFRITEEAGPLYQEAARRLIERVAVSDDGSEAALALGRLVGRLRGSLLKLCDLVADGLATRDQWLERVGGETWSRENLLAWRQEVELEALLDALGERSFERLVDGLLVLATLSDDEEAGRELGDGLAAWRQGGAGLNERVHAAWTALMAVKLKSDWKPMATRTVRSQLLQGQGESRTEELEEIAQVCEQWRDDPAASRLYGRFTKAPPLDLEQRNEELMQWMHRLLLQACAELHVLFAERGVCDFQHMARLAMGALGDEGTPGAALLLEDARLEHILMDEFQDTSHIQYQLLYRLTAGWEPEDGRTLFLVGDPMQSIYRFRKADVALFTQTWEQERFGDIELQRIRLSANFRSRREVIEFVNTECPRFFTTPTAAATAAVAYERVEAQEGAGGAVVLHPNPKGEGPEEEARQIVAVIERALEVQPDAKVGVLGRGRKQLAPVAAGLARAGIAFEAVDVQNLARRPVVQDLLTLVRALAHPADRVAWLGLLHAPWCGLDPGQAHLVAGEAFDIDILERISEQSLLEALPEPARRRVERLHEIMCLALRSAADTPLHRRAEAAWIGLRGPCALSGPNDLQDAGSFLELLARLEAEQPGDLMGELRRRLENLHAASSPAQVQLMTIHKAKGLEFDTVVLPGLDGGSRRSDQPLFRHHEFRLGAMDGALLAPLKPSGAAAPSLYDYLGELDREEQKGELQRLLYVALTRAKRELHLFGRWNPSKSGPSAPAGSLLELLWPPFLEEIQSGELEQASAVMAPPDSVDTRRLPMLYLEGEPSPAIERRPRSASERRVEIDMPDRDALALGEAFHQWLELIHDHWEGRWQPDWTKSYLPALESSLRGAGARPSSLPGLVEKLEQMLQQALDSPEVRDLLAPTGKDESLAEAAYCRAEGSRLSFHIIDRLYRTADGNWTIIDYKTTAMGTAAVDEWRSQLGRYRVLVEAESGETVTSCAVYNAHDQSLVDITTDE